MGRGRPRRTDCKQCGVTKTFANCGIKSDGYWQGYCKRCFSIKNRMCRNERGFWEYVIYLFKDTGLTVTRVGATGRYHGRIRDHYNHGTIFPNEVPYIVEKFECLTKEEGAAWGRARENYYMDLHRDTIRNGISSGLSVHSYSVHDD